MKKFIKTSAATILFLFVFMSAKELMDWLLNEYKFLKYLFGIPSLIIFLIMTHQTVNKE